MSVLLTRLFGQPATTLRKDEDDQITSDQTMSVEQVQLAYQRLLGRAPERPGIGRERSTFDTLLYIATSEEHRQFILREAASRQRYCITSSESGAFVTYGSDKVIGAMLRDAGHFEEDAIDQTIRLIEQCGRRTNRSTFLDVGANIGTHSIRALRQGFERAICVEADQDNFRVLRVNQILNEVDHLCTNFLMAASEKDGEALIQLSPTNFGDHRIKGTGIAASIHGEQSWNVSPVRTMRLDAILKKSGISPSEIGLIWIDTQGHDGHVLSGASDILRSEVPIVVEFWPYGLQRSDGYQRFKENIFCRSIVIDLRKSDETGSPCRVSAAELDKKYEAMLASESTSISPHTDLLLL